MNGEDIVECLLLPDIPVWVGKENEEVSLNKELLVILVLLSNNRRRELSLVENAHGNHSVRKRKKFSCR